MTTARSRCRLAALVAAALAASPTLASAPWPRPIEGCVRGGVLIEETRGRAYPIRVRERPGGRETPLAMFEGRRIRFASGYLLPGDIYVRRSSPRVVGRCR